MLISEFEDHVIEECSELIQAILKARRFGYNNYNPKTPEITNYTQIRRGIRDVRLSINQLVLKYKLFDLTEF